MQLIKFSKAALLAILLSAGATACSGGNDEKKDPKEVAEDQNDSKFKKSDDPQNNRVAEKDAQALVDAYSAGLYEIMMADTGAVYAKSKEAKDLATMLIETHTKTNGQMRELAAGKQISLPNDISAEQIADIAKMRDQKMMAFDRNYASVAVVRHNELVTIYEKCANDCEDADIKMWFRNAIPDLLNHLGMAKSVEEKLKTMK